MCPCGIGSIISPSDLTVLYVFLEVGCGYLGGAGLVSQEAGGCELHQEHGQHGPRQIQAPPESRALAPFRGKSQGRAGRRVGHQYYQYG